MKNIFKILFGIILLLPGICSLGFMIMLGLSPGPQWLIWITCFAISAVGIMLLRNARQKPGPQGTQPIALNNKDRK